MNLVKEKKIIYGKEEGYIKEYDLNGNLIIFNEFTQSTIYIYDSQKRIINERLDTGFKNLWYVKEYEYNPFGYRAFHFEYKSKDENYTLKEFDISKTNNAEVEKKLLSHEDVVIEDKNVISKKLSNYKTNDIKLTQYEYKNGLITLKIHYSIIQNQKEVIKKTEFTYDSQNRILEKKTTDVLNGFNSKLIEYDYSNEKVIESTFDINRENILDQIEIYFDKEGNITKKSDGTIFLYVKEFNYYLKKEFLTTIIEAGYDESSGTIGIGSVTSYEYAKNPFDTKYCIWNQAKQ